MTDFKHSGFMNYEAIKNRSDPKEGTIIVRCYHSGLYYVCPDPLDKKRREDHQYKLSMGGFISYEDITITGKTYKDPSCWN